MDSIETLAWEVVPSAGLVGFMVFKARVEGGWLVMVQGPDGTPSLSFVPAIS